MLELEYLQSDRGDDLNDVPEIPRFNAVIFHSASTGKDSKAASYGFLGFCIQGFIFLHQLMDCRSVHYHDHAERIHIFQRNEAGTLGDILGGKPMLVELCFFPIVEGLAETEPEGLRAVKINVKDDVVSHRILLSMQKSPLFQHVQQRMHLPDNFRMSFFLIKVKYKIHKLTDFLKI